MVRRSTQAGERRQAPSMRLGYHGQAGRLLKDYSPPIKQDCVESESSDGDYDDTYRIQTRSNDRHQPTSPVQLLFTRNLSPLQSNEMRAASANASGGLRLAYGSLATYDRTKLKGILCPGMDIFDSATMEVRCRRNQKKHFSALVSLEATSNGGGCWREREITGSLNSEDDPVEGESEPEPEVTDWLLALCHPQLDSSKELRGYSFLRRDGESFPTVGLALLVDIQHFAASSPSPGFGSLDLHSPDTLARLDEGGRDRLQRSGLETIPSQTVLPVDTAAAAEGKDDREDSFQRSELSRSTDLLAISPAPANPAREAESSAWCDWADWTWLLLRELRQGCAPVTYK